jgi:hypothetical protein
MKERILCIKRIMKEMKISGHVEYVPVSTASVILVP